MLTPGPRAGDIACRYGGEEFVLILPGTNLDTATEIADRIRADLEGLPNGYAAVPGIANLKLSAGVAGMPLHGTDADAVVRAADQALYSARDDGRNRFSTAVA